MDKKKEKEDFLRQCVLHELSRDGYTVPRDVKLTMSEYEVTKAGKEYLVRVQVKNFMDESKNTRIEPEIVDRLKSKADEENRKVLYALGANYQMEDTEGRGIHVFWFDIEDLQELKDELMKDELGNPVKKAPQKVLLWIKSPNENKELRAISRKLKRKEKITHYRHVDNSVIKSEIHASANANKQAKAQPKPFPRKGQKPNREKKISPAERKAIEESAVKKVTEYYKADYEVNSVESEYCGWDLNVGRDLDVKIDLRVEVKGHKGNGIKFELTPNEYEQMRDDKYKDSYRVGYVRNALTEPDLTIWKPEECESPSGWCLFKVYGSAEIEKIELKEKTAAGVDE